ncbi:MAG: HhoA/HhoB/HtrA family serine endopeptidase [Microcoleaceae cyanobacterium]
MSRTTEKIYWRQPIACLLLLLLGAGAALTGERWLKARFFPEKSLAEQPLGITDAEIPAAAAAPQAPAWRVPKPGGGSTKPTNPNFIVAAVDQVGPAVVRINASRRPDPGFESFNEPLPDEFFDGRPYPSDPLEQGTGSGFILSSEGHILTNSHVVENTETVQVGLKDGRWFKGRVLGTDPVTDVAVIKIAAKDLPVVQLGNSDALSPGEWAIAIGNPLGLDNSVTVGIISATGRSSSDVGVPDKRIGFIQTDAAINPGNSGGPLLNAQGQVVGMNTAIIDGAQGLGFAIPINHAQEIAQQLISTGRAEHAYLGIEMVTLSAETREQLEPVLGEGFQIDRGVLIINVAPGSPAEQAGLQSGDVILKIDDRAITRSEAVQQAVQRKAVGTTLQVEVNRNGQIVNVSVQTGKLPPV